MSGLERVRVWRMPVRVMHWLVFASVVVLAATGIYLGHPFIIVAGPARDHFVMGWMKTVHFYAAIVFTVTVLSRIAYMFSGDEHANWRNFVPTTRLRWKHLIETLQFYALLKRKPPETVGHNAMAGAAYVAIFGLYMIMIVTGSAIYSVDAAQGSPMQVFRFLVPLVGGLQWARWIHHVGMWLLLGFVVQHVYSSILMAAFEKTGTMDSIFSGHKWVERKDA